MRTLRLVVPVLVAALGALAPRSVAACDSAEEYAARAKALASRAATMEKADVAKERYALGLFAREHGLEEAAVREFRGAVGADPDHEPARLALGDVRLGTRWVPQDEAMAAKGMVRRGGTWILREEAEILDLPARERELRREQHGKVEKLLVAYANGSEVQRKFAAESLGTVEARHKLEPLAYALRTKSEKVRLLAAQELGRLGNRRALKPLVHRAMSDASEAVRNASVDAAKAIGDENLAAPFVKALGSEDADARMRAAVALGRIGDVRTIRYLVWRFEAHGGGAPRAYFFTANQLTYIQDFDVEVAQTAFIADPIIGIIQDGIVLDVTVVATERVAEFTEREVVHTVLRGMTGATDVQNKPGAWAAWWRDHEKDYVAAK